MKSYSRPDYFNTNLRPKLAREASPPEYRVHYDIKTGTCTHKTNMVTDISDNYIVVDKNQYDAIEFCGNYRVVNKKIEKLDSIVPLPQNKKLMSMSDKGRFLTLKNNMIFVVDDFYTGEFDCWGHV